MIGMLQHQDERIVNILGVVHGDREGNHERTHYLIFRGNGETFFVCSLF